jgi:thiamine transport system ATP-binding protein
MTGAAIRFEDVGFSYGEEGFSFDFEVEAGEIVAIMGASGSGKSTLLNLLAGFETPRSGRILIGGRDVTRLAPHERPVSMVFQENNLFGHLDVAANVGLGLSPSLRLRPGDRRLIAEALAETGLAGMERRLPGELSGGERQRVALARAFVRDRPVLLLDEPFASLGPALRHEMVSLVRELHRRRQMTILIVSHHPEDAASLAGRVFFLDQRRVAHVGPTGRLLSAEAPPAIARYLGEMTGS